MRKTAIRKYKSGRNRAAFTSARKSRADVDGPVAVGAETPHLPGLQNAQKLGLELGGQLADFIEENRPPAGLLEDAGTRLGGTGKGSPFVSKQFGLEEVLGDGRAIDNPEGLLLPATLGVDGLGSLCLSGARLPLEKNGDVADGGALEETKASTGHGRLADQRPKFGALGEGKRGAVCNELEAQARLAELEQSAFLQLGLADADTVDAGAVTAAQVLHP